MVHEQKKQVFELPISVVSVVEVARLNHEIEEIDAFLHQASIRKSGEKITMPRMSKMLEDVAEHNHLNLLHETDRATLKAVITQLKNEAPVIHMSFATEPSQAFLKRLMTWLRDEIHPAVLLQIGLQPSIAGGCVVRTTNKSFDFSLRKYFDGTKQQLIERIEAKA